jgi:hypothetical protein
MFLYLQPINLPLYVTSDKQTTNTRNVNDWRILTEWLVIIFTHWKYTLQGQGI